MQPELEAGDDAEVATTATDGPEQVGVLGLARDEDAAVGRHDLDRDQRVDRHAVLACEPADPAAEGEAGDADAAGVAERRRQAMLGRGDRVLAGGQAGAGPGQPGDRVDVQALHGAEVEDDAAVARSVASEAVTAAADGELEPGLGREQHGSRDVGRRDGTDDAQWAPVGERVVDLAGVVVARILGTDDGAGDPGRERVEVLGAEGRGCEGEGGGGDTGEDHCGTSFRCGGAATGGREWEVATGAPSQVPRWWLPRPAVPAVKRSQPPVVA